MAIKVTCECGKRFSASDEFEGRRAICPSCRREFVFQAKGLPIFAEDTEPATPPRLEKSDATTPILPRRSKFFAVAVVVLIAAISSGWLAWPYIREKPKPKPKTETKVSTVNAPRKLEINTPPLKPKAP